MYFLEALGRLHVALGMLFYFTAIGVCSGFVIGCRYAWASLTGGREGIDALTEQYQDELKHRRRSRS